MRKLLLLFSLSIVLTAKAQTSVYHPFPDSDAVWTQEYIGDDYPTCHSTATFSYVMQGDTIINALNYHKINIPYVNWNYNNPNCMLGPNCPGSCWELRQDTALRKVFVPGNTS